MNWDQFNIRIRKILPFADIQRDNEGQLVIYTGLKVDENEEVSEIFPEEVHLAFDHWARRCE